MPTCPAPVGRPYVADAAPRTIAHPPDATTYHRTAPRHAHRSRRGRSPDLRTAVTHPPPQRPI